MSVCLTGQYSYQSLSVVHCTCVFENVISSMQRVNQNMYLPVGRKGGNYVYFYRFRRSNGYTV